MKRIIVVISLVLFTYSFSFAAATGDIATTYTNAGKTVAGGNDAAVGTPKSIGKLSTGVDLAFTTSTVGYSLITQHKNGVKSFGTSHDSTAIYSKNSTKAGAVTAVAADSSAFVASWTSM